MLRSIVLSLLAGCLSLPPQVADVALTLDGAPVEVLGCWSGCREDYPCGGAGADLHGSDIDSFTVQAADAHLRLWDDAGGTGGAWYDGPCIAWETQWQCGGIFWENDDDCGWVDVCVDELDVDLGACWSGVAEFAHASRPGDITGVYAVIDGEVDCQVEGRALKGTIRCREGDYPE